MINVRLPGPTLTVCGLVALLLMQSAQIVVGWRRHAAPTPVGATSGSNATPRAGDTALAERIAAAHLFGVAPGADPAVDPARAPEDSSGYRLLGVIGREDPAAGFAIIASPDGSGHMFRTGESVSPALRLLSVMRDYVLLASAIGTSRLDLPRAGLAGLAEPGGGGATAAATRRRLALRAPPPAPVSTAADAPLTPETVQTLDAFHLTAQRDSAGRVTGLEGNGFPSWKKSGVRPDDVIVAIDGTPIGDVLHTPAAIDVASQAAVATLTVLRNGEEITVQASQQAAETSNLALRARQQRAGS